MNDPMAWLREAAKAAPAPAPNPRPARRAEGAEPTPANHPMAWADHGACAGMDPELFFPFEDGGDAVDPRAVAACRRCEVRSACLDWALRREPMGYWGGQTERARHRLRRTLGIVEPLREGDPARRADELTGATPPYPNSTTDGGPPPTSQQQPA